MLNSKFPINSQFVAVVGSSWGDEGKAKIVDSLAAQFDYVVRYQGGDNAGHSVYISENERRVFRLIPSGVLNTKAIIAHGVVVNPQRLTEEIASVENIVSLKDRLFVSAKAHVIFDWAIALDKLIEDLKTVNKVGTTGKGIGPTYAFKALRINSRLEHLLDRETLHQHIEYALKLLNPIFKTYNYPEFNVEESVEKYYNLGKQIAPYLIDTVEFLHRGFREGKKFLLEGSQGLLLDLDMGTYPFVTSSSVIGALSSGTGLPPGAFKDGIIGLVKAYASRVGQGEFPTEMEDEAIAKHIRDTGNEYGSVTGRPRRIGWLDLVCLKYSATFSGMTDIALTLVDVLNGLPEVKVCTDYIDEKGNSVGFNDRLNNITPIYKTFKGWNEDFTKIKEYSDFSDELKAFVSFIGEYIGVKVSIVSFGTLRQYTVAVE